MHTQPFVPSAQNALEFFTKLNAATAEIALLKSQLRSAELLSAANLGVHPVEFTQATVSGDVAAVYAGMMAGPEKTAFYRKHAARIWAKVEGNAAE